MVWVYDGGRVGYEGCGPDGARQERDHTAPHTDDGILEYPDLSPDTPPARAQAPNPHYCGKQRQREQRAARQSVEVQAGGARAAASCLAWATRGLWVRYAGRARGRGHVRMGHTVGGARACTLSRGAASSASKITTTRAGKQQLAQLNRGQRRRHEGEVREGRSGRRFGPAFRVK